MARKRKDDQGDLLDRIASRSDQVMTEEDRGIRDTEVAHILGISRTMVHELARDPVFPAAFRCGRAKRYVLSEILHWMKNVAKRDGQ